MKKQILTLMAASAVPFLLTQCASFESAAVADYNRDGHVSDAEYRQYSKQKSVERQNVYTERAKRDNAVDTVRDARNAAWNARSLKGILENF